MPRGRPVGYHWVGMLRYTAPIVLIAKMAFGSWSADDKAVAMARPIDPYGMLEDVDGLVDYGEAEDRAFKMATMLTTDPYVYDPRFFRAADALLKLEYPRIVRHIILFCFQGDEGVRDLWSQSFPYILMPFEFSSAG